MSDKPKPIIEEDPDCCDIWPQIADRFDWMKYDHQREMGSMPHINVGARYFVNFCPACGKPARNRNMLFERIYNGKTDER